MPPKKDRPISAPGRLLSSPPGPAPAGPPNGAPTPQGYPLTAWSALLLPTTSPAAAIACTANDHGQKEREKADRRRDRTPPEDRPHPTENSTAPAGLRIVTG